MTDFDRQLSEALKRREPPRDLTASVMARIERTGRRGILPGSGNPAVASVVRSVTGERRTALRRWIPAWAAIAAILLLSIGVYRRWEEVQKGREAKRQVMLALEVTTQKLAVAQKRVNELNHRRIGYE
jgi:hypothetical protein